MANIFVRAFIPEDVVLINKWRNDPKIQYYTVGISRKVSLEMEKEWLHQKMMNNIYDIYWAICANDESQKMIGYASFININYVNRVVDGGGIVIGDKKYRDGICIIEAMLIKLDFAFNTLNMNRYCAAALNSHKISNPLMESLLFKREGVLRQHVYKHGEYHDVISYALLKSEYDEYVQSGEYSVPKIIKRFVSKSRNSVEPLI